MAENHQIHKDYQGLQILQMTSDVFFRMFFRMLNLKTAHLLVSPSLDEVCHVHIPCSSPSPHRQENGLRDGQIHLGQSATSILVGGLNPSEKY